MGGSKDVKKMNCIKWETIWMKNEYGRPGLGELKSLMWLFWKNGVGGWRMTVRDCNIEF